MRIHKRYNNPFLFAWCVFLMPALFVSIQSNAQENPTDSISVLPADSIQIQPQDSVVTDSIEPAEKKEVLDAPITYEAQDSIVFLGNGTGFLYGSAAMQYKEIDLKANFIRVNMDSTTIYASGTTDSTGVVSGSPIFTEKESSYEAKEMTYNLNTKKGFIRQVVTQQGEGYIISDKTKKDENDLLCMVDGKYTTCDNHEHPHFYLQLTKAKVKPGEYVAAGPAYLVVADVPLPLAIPFGFFPFTSQYSSGIIMPNYGDDSSRGFYLQGGGYYFAINDYFDLELLGDIYTKGTWAITANTNYVKRYKFRGSFNLTYRNDVTSEKDLPDYSVAKNLSIRWSHSQDAKANPYSTFSASVNFSTSGYNRSNINSYYNPELNSENTKSSSVSFTQRFPDSPWSLSGSAMVTQRTKDSTINMTLPSLSVTMSRIYPFKRKNPVGKERWYEKISLSYTGTMSNSIETKENMLLHSSLTKDWKNGINHNIPISASFNVLKYINISPSASYTERWYFKRVDQSWDEENNEVKMDTTNGFYRVYNFNVGVSASTKLYGFFIPNRKIFGDKIDRFRHVLTPSIGFTWAPDFGNSWFNYYGTYDKPVTNYVTGEPDIETITYSRYAGALYGTPGQGKTGSINFSLANNLEMKVRNDRDTTGDNPFKVISLIDNFSINGSYNIAADSMKWSNFNATLRIKLKNYSLNLTGSFDPYMYGLTTSGSPVRINELRWNHGKFPRFLGTSTSYSYTFNNDTFKKWFGKKGKNTDTENPDGTTDDPDNLASDNPPNSSDNSTNNTGNTDSQTVDADGYAKVSIPWSISISYTLRYAQSSNFNYDKMEYDMKFTHNLNLSGSIGLGAGWKISTSTSYDFEAKKFSYSSFNVSRSLHCWSMSGSFVPFGIYKSYNFKIGVNASMLADLKYEKQSEYGRSNVNWW